VKEYNVVGKPVPLIDAPEKVTGKALFTADIKLPGLLHAKILRSPHAHAKILRVDTSVCQSCRVQDGREWRPVFFQVRHSSGEKLRSPHKLQTADCKQQDTWSYSSTCKRDVAEADAGNKYTEKLVKTSQINSQSDDHWPGFYAETVCCMNWTISVVGVPGPNTAWIPLSFKVLISSSGMMPPPMTIMSVAPAFFKSSITLGKR